MKNICTLFVIIFVFNCWFNIANAQTVNMPDANLATIVRKTLKLTPHETLTRQAIQRLTFLNAQGFRVKNVLGTVGEIRDLTGLEQATQLEILFLSDNAISDLTPLGKLTNLTELYLSDNTISDLTPLGKLTKLEALDINNNTISDLTPLGKLTKLTKLYISGNSITDLILLEKLTKLEALDISGYAISNITMLEKLTKLELLHLSDNTISDITPIAKLSQLRVLDLRKNTIIDVSSLATLKNLERLKLAENAIVDVSSLAGLNSLTRLDLQDNAIIDISPLTTLKNTSFSLDGNPITVNFPLITNNSTELTSGGFIVLSRNKNHSIARSKVNIIYPDWEAFIEANPVILNNPRDRRNNVSPLVTLAKRINDTLNNFRNEGEGGTIELIAHPKTKAKFGDLIISEIMWGRYENPLDNQWIELYSPSKHVKLVSNRFTLLFTGTYLDREVIPSSQPYEGWTVIDRVRNAGSSDSLGWQLPQRTWGTEAAQSPVSMSRVIDYETEIIPDGSLENSWIASSFRENLSSISYGSPGARGEPKVYISASQRPPIYWVDETFGMLQRLTDTQAENVMGTTQNTTSLVVDPTGEKIYWTEKISDTIGKIHRSNLDGSEVEELKSFLGSVPLSIAVDSTGGKLYWTSSSEKIKRSNLNGKSVVPLIQNLNSPKAIDLDVTGGKIYWTQQGSIWRADLNGENAEEFITGLKEVEDIDVAGSYIYWTEKTGSNLGAVKRANLDGTNSEELISYKDVVLKGIAVDLAGNKLYWADSGGRIRRANLNGSETQRVVTGLAPLTHLALNVSVPEDPAAPSTTLLAPSQSPTATPQETDLLANYPNPFNPETWIPYQLATSANVQILIYDARGAIVRRLELGHQPPGYYTGQSRAAYWDGRNGLGEPVASGIYFYQLQTDEISLLRKMVILK